MESKIYFWQESPYNFTTVNIENTGKSLGIYGPGHLLATRCYLGIVVLEC